MKRTFAVVAALLLGHVCFASTAAFWEMTSFSDFVKGKFDGVSLGRDGRLSLAPKLDTVFTSGQPVIWSVVSGPDGALYAGTGHSGRVFRIEPNGSAKLIWTADRPEVFAVAVDPHGVIYAASSPAGKIYRIENGSASEYFDPRAKYIWALALAPDGTLYAGTGDKGVVYRITGPGKGEPYYLTGQANVTGLLLDSEGRLLAGTEPSGVLFRITAKDKAFALYDSSLPEIRAVAPAPDGSIYAVALGGALEKRLQAAQVNANASGDSSAPAAVTVTVTADAGGDLKPTPPAPAKPAQAAPATDTPSVSAPVADANGANNAEKSAIYRIRPDNTVETLWSSKEENVYDILASADGQVYFGTDSSGRIYRLSPDRKLTLVAQTNESQAVKLVQTARGMLAATGNMGNVYRLGQPGARGTYESPVFDAGSVARWGKIRWDGPGGTVSIRTRSGNSARPDETWSDWSGQLRAGSGSQIASPNARYLQYEAELSGPGAFIDNVSAAYLPQNNPPVVRSITVLAAAAPNSSPGVKASSSASGSAAFTVTVTDTGDATPVSSTGTPTQTLSRAASQQLMISWQADDPDNDRLVYELDFRGEGEHDWKPLRKDLHDASYAVDADALADGRYFFRVVASDRESNPGRAAQEAELVSSPVLIDNTPPTITVRAAARSGNGADIQFEAHDAASALRRAEWSLDAGAWLPLAPVSGILDSPSEEFRLHIDSVPPGEHVLVLRVADSGNNTGLAKVVLR